MCFDFNELNKTYNELTIKGPIEKPNTDKYKSWNSVWVHCECSCGCDGGVDVPLYGIKKGFIKSCGHLRSEVARKSLKKIHETNPTPTAIYLTYEDKTLNISEWAEETGIPRTTIMYRMNKGLPIEKILERKPKKNG